MKALKLFPVLIALVGLLVWTSCDKEDDANGTSRMTVKMTDAPADYEAVFVEIDHVEVYYEDNKKGDNGWVTLNTKAGIYDLLDLRNGVTVVLADGEEIPAGKISQMRLVLGSQNTIVVAGVSFDLTTPSAQNSGLKINIDHQLEADHDYEIVLDFDAEQSIVLEGNGSYSLKPVIKVNSLIEL